MVLLSLRIFSLPFYRQLTLIWVLVTLPVTNPKPRCNTAGASGAGVPWPLPV